MALIKCPECGKEISDVVASCPHCGYPIQKPPERNLGVLKRFAPVFAVALVLLAAALIFAGISRQRAEAELVAERSAYIANLKELRVQVIRAGSYAETVCNMTKRVWSNTIYEKKDSATDKYTINKRNKKFYSDFNTSLSNLYADDDIKKVVSALEASRIIVDSIMSNLQNPTDEFSACYETADSLYDAYCDLITLAISPSGSLLSYSENFNNYDSALLKYYNKLETMIPDE